MTKKFCKCGNFVAEGETNLFGKKKFEMKGKPKGTMIKHSSNNPNNWDWVCSECQSKESPK